MQSEPPPLDPPIDSLPTGTYSIRLEGEWSFEDLYIFPHTFEQVYFLIYSLLPGHHELDLERIKHAYSTFPWRGGYSAVNFYNQLKFMVQSRERPQLIAINYSSPGLIEIGLILVAATTIGRIVKSISASIDHANQTYGNIIKKLRERKLLRLEEQRQQLSLRTDERRIEATLQAEEVAYITKSLESMAQLLGFDNIGDMNEKTGSPYISLKILLSLYRRVRMLAEYERRGKTIFPDDKRGGRDG